MVATWIVLGVVGWALGFSFLMILMRMAGSEDRSARYEEKRRDRLASHPSPANGSSRIWTERDDELSAFTADMRATAIGSEAPEAAIPPEEDAVGIDAGYVRAAA